MSDAICLREPQHQGRICRRTPATIADSLGYAGRPNLGEPVSNIETVKAIYEAFGRGDVNAILDKLDDGVEWETTVPLSDVPWL